MTDYGKLFDGPDRTRAVRGKVVVDWRDCRDEQFVRALRPVSAKLKTARSLYRTDPARAKRTVVEHFLNRPSPRWAFDYRKKRADFFPSRNFFFDEAIDLRMARRALRYEFYDSNRSGNYHRLTRAVDWTGAQLDHFGSAGWLTMCFGYWALFPAAGYAMTHDPRYARVLARCWQRWFEDFPTKATDVGLRGWGCYNTRHPVVVESCINVGRRQLILIDTLYSGILAALPADLAFEILKYLWFCSNLIMEAYRRRDGRPVFGAGNHNLFDRGTVPFCAGVMFPEFRYSATLRTIGRSILREHARDPERGAIRSDNSSWEHSARYAWYAAGMFRQPLEIARINGTPLFPSTEEKRVCAFLDSFADLTAPDGQMIPYGDCQPPKSGCHLELARSVYSGSRSQGVGRKLDALTTVHSPARRPVPVREATPASRFFPNSGILVARTGWRPTDSLLFVTADPRSTYSGHSHHDFGSFQLWADGVPIFYDAPTWAYRIDEIIPAERGYYYSAFSHNLLTVEGYRPRSVFRQMGNVNQWWGDEDNPPVRTESLELEGPRGALRVSHGAYPGLRVVRTYRFDLAARSIEICDEITATVRKRRTFRQWFHLDFGAEAILRAPGKLTVRHRGVKAVCAWSSSLPFRTRVERSREVERAAEVFRLGRPRRAYAEIVTASRGFDLTCRVEW